jgi:hypothetical protein
VTTNTTVVKEFAWSYSQLKNFETCEARYYHYQVAKDVKEPETAQLKSGNDLHYNFDKRIADNKALPLGYGQYENMLAKFIASPGETYSEQKLAFTKELQPVGFFGKGVWFRTVIDATKVRDDHTATVLDWKTGKPSPDITQLQLMAATLFIHLPHLQRVKAALVFVNYNEVERAEFVRGDQAEIWSEILPRVKAVQRARDTNSFPPKPSGLCKKYCAVATCPYYQKGGR